MITFDNKEFLKDRYFFTIFIFDLVDPKIFPINNKSDKWFYEYNKVYKIK